MVEYTNVTLPTLQDSLHVAVGCRTGGRAGLFLRILFGKKMARSMNYQVGAQHGKLITVQEEGTPDAYSGNGSFPALYWIYFSSARLQHHRSP